MLARCPLIIQYQVQTMKFPYFKTSQNEYIKHNADAGDYKEVLGNEPIKTTLSLSLCSLSFSGFTFENRPESNPEPDPPPNKSRSPLISALTPEVALLIGCAGSSSLRRAPQVQSMTFLKQGLWNTDSQDGHLSISSSCQ